MSTRATITVDDRSERFHLYQHSDGYPEGQFGLVRRLANAPKFAWDPPRFEAADFAASVVAVLKDRGGSTYLTKRASAHADRDYHYDLSRATTGVSTQVNLNITKFGFGENADKTIFDGTLPEAVKRFDAATEGKAVSRELAILAEADGALWRAYDEISALCGNRPDPDTQKVYEDIETASRALARLKEHLRVNDPWTALRHLKDKDFSAKLVSEAHQRFQR